jgi:hypothetical protein
MSKPLRNASLAGSFHLAAIRSAQAASSESPGTYPAFTPTLVTIQKPGGIIASTRSLGSIFASALLALAGSILKLWSISPTHFLVIYRY